MTNSFTKTLGELAAKATLQDVDKFRSICERIDIAFDEDMGVEPEAADTIVRIVSSPEFHMNGSSHTFLISLDSIVGEFPRNVRESLCYVFLQNLPKLRDPIARQVVADMIVKLVSPSDAILALRQLSVSTDPKVRDLYPSASFELLRSTQEESFREAVEKRLRILSADTDSRVVEEAKHFLSLIQRSVYQRSVIERSRVPQRECTVEVLATDLLSAICTKDESRLSEVCDLLNERYSEMIHESKVSENIFHTFMDAIAHPNLTEMRTAPELFELLLMNTVFISGEASEKLVTLLSSSYSSFSFAASRSLVLELILALSTDEVFLKSMCRLVEQTPQSRLDVLPRTIENFIQECEDATLRDSATTILRELNKAESPNVQREAHTSLSRLGLLN